MSEIFISYSRHDLAFVGKLRTLLENEGLGAWVDIEGLYAGEEFWPEVAKAIDAAVVFVFVMSPDSIASRFCGLELEHAIEGQKRIVPLCYRDVNTNGLNPEIASRQWVFFRNGDDAETAESELLSAVRADWAWLREQARLLRRAQEWKQKDRNTSLLLRGSDLRDAESWLSQSDERESGATPLHRAFIAESRRATGKRRLLLSVAAVLSLVIVLVVSWFGLAQKVASLNNLSLDDLNRAQVEAAIDKLGRAQIICKRFRHLFEGCADAELNLGRALLDAGRYGDGIEQLTHLIDTARHIDASGEPAAHYLATVYQNRCYGRIMLAETDLQGDERLNQYGRAEEDLKSATELYQFATEVTSGRRLPIEITWARIHIGRGHYETALEQLQRAGRFSNTPDIDLLQSIAHHCLGNGLKSIEHIRRFFDALPGKRDDPHWRRNMLYYRRLRERCIDIAN
jgi:tetratricopeptide (TPR) repeat protein